MGSAGPQTPPIGTTVTLQVATPVGPVGVVGVLVDATDDTWFVRRRDGSVSEVDLASIRAWRVVPPGRAARATVAEVARLGASGWRALEVEPLGEWQLRASSGFTSRGNSVLAVGEPGVPIAAALDLATDWYAARGLPTRLQLVDRAAPDGLAAELDRRGWAVVTPTLVMTAELGHVLRAAPGGAGGAAGAAGAARAAPGPAGGGLEVRLDDAPDEAWLGCYRADGTGGTGGTGLPPAARAVLTNHPAAVFASVRDGERCVAIARATVDDRWAGLHAVEVSASDRGHGLGAVVSAAALRWCGQRGARRTYLQVAAGNVHGVRLWERLNFAVHHGYEYRDAPPTG